MAAEEKNGLFELHENTRAGVLANPTLPNRAISIAVDTRTLIARTSAGEVLEFEAGAKLNVDLLGVPGGVAQLGGDGKLPNSALSDNGSDATPQDLVEVPLAGTATTYSRGDHKHKYPTPTQIGAEPNLGTPGAGTWFLRAVAGVRSWVQLGSLAFVNSVENSNVAVGAAIAWGKISKSGAIPTDIGAADAEHFHHTNDISGGVLPIIRGGTGLSTLPAGFVVSLNEQIATLPQAEKSVAFYETAHGGFNAATLSAEFEITGPPTGPTIGIAEVAWSKVDKAGAAATDVGALPATAVSGAINFDSINGGLPCAWSLAGASYTNGPPGASSTTGYFLVQGVGRDGLRTQYVTDTKFGGSFHRFQTSSGGGAWSSWFAILDDSREGVDPKSGNWTVNPLTKKMVKQTSAGTITLPTASATYAGFRTTVTSTFAGNITIAGTFEYLDPNNTPSYWYNTAGSLAFAVNSGSGSGYRVSFDIWCDGVYWYVRF